MRIWNILFREKFLQKNNLTQDNIFNYKKSVSISEQYSENTFGNFNSL